MSGNPETNPTTRCVLFASEITTNTTIFVLLHAATVSISLALIMTSSMQHIPQRIHQLQEGISMRPIIGQLLEGRVTGDIQPNDSKNLTEGDSYEFSRFYVIHNS
ncbi:hypothetical protein HID58_014217 [Brassica napus]|uniref:Peptidylprolyl isomerase n=1 Tax=Brassica napus TaxID=3708 RepID=A0ABQ8DGI8_BRANA|nr:hypothetical protein HID58_014217 [Brassica napus]